MDWFLYDIGLQRQRVKNSLIATRKKVVDNHLGLFVKSGKAPKVQKVGNQYYIQSFQKLVNVQKQTLKINMRYTAVIPSTEVTPKCFL